MTHLLSFPLIVDCSFSNTETCLEFTGCPTPHTMVPREFCRHDVFLRITKFVIDHVDQVSYMSCSGQLGRFRTKSRPLQIVYDMAGTLVRLNQSI